MNLVVNARDAMPEGGTVTVETLKHSSAGKNQDLQPDATAGSLVVLAVSDTGTGMDEETKIRIFEPFYPTFRTWQGHSEE